MKQLEIDGEIQRWFEARERQLAASRELNSANVNLLNITETVAKRLMPSDAIEGEIYIFPSTDGKAVRAFLKPKTTYEVGGGAVKGFEAAVEPHNFNRK